MNKYFLVILSALLFCSCRKTTLLENNIVKTDTVYIARHDTIIKVKNDTLIKTWRDTILKIVSDTLVVTKHDTTYVTKHDSVVIIRYQTVPNVKTQIFFLGTSITYGYSSTYAGAVPVPSGAAYPADVSSFFSSTTKFGGWTNLGIPGATVSIITNNEIPIVIQNRDSLNYSQTVAIMEEGINNYVFGDNAQDIYNGIKANHQLLHQKGIKTIVVVPTPVNNSIDSYNGNADSVELIRQQLITLLLAGWKNDIGAIAIVDLSKDPYVGLYVGASGFDLSVFQPDGIHFTPLGYSIIASDVEKVLLGIN